MKKINDQNEAAMVRAYSCRACQKVGKCSDLKQGGFCEFALMFAGLNSRQTTLGMQ